MTSDLSRQKESGFSDKWWLIACIFIAGSAAFLRFFLLEMKPMHHDEGVNGHFLTRLMREGIYQYDPANYHGPDLYYLSLAFVKVFGLNALSVRASVAVFGVLTVALAFFLKRYIGKIGSLTAAFFLALTPGMVYISRYFIHEILFVFFSFAIVVSILFFIEKRKAGIFAIGWMALILMICFLPVSLNLASYLGGENTTLLWSLRVLIILIESVFVLFIIRGLLDWDNGRPIYLMLASASTAFLFATKETAFITIGTMLIACVCVWIWQKINFSAFVSKNRKHFFTFGQIAAAAILLIAAIFYFEGLKEFYYKFYGSFTGDGIPDQSFLFYSIILLGLLALLAYLIFFLGERKTENELLQAAPTSKFIEPHLKDFRAALGSGKARVAIIIVSCAVFIYIGALFFSSFFTYKKGILAAFEAYAIWTKTGANDHTQNGTLAYLKWLLSIEAPILILSFIGALISLVKTRHRFAVFTAFWAFGLFLAYTIIPYKTPWLMLSFTLPMCVIAGYGINELATSRKPMQKFLAGILVVISAGILSFQTYDLNFIRYDSDRLPYVYAHTQRGFLDLISEIKRYAEKSGKKEDATIEIVSPDYWPMPWYLNNYEHANFHGKTVNANTAEMIIASEKQIDELAARYGAHYKYAGTYPLRPGVKLYLLVRNDLADSIDKSIYQIPREE